MKPTFAGIIFDFNGVLLWDGHLQEQAWQTFSAQLRGEPFTAEEMLTLMHGRSNRYLLEYLVGHPLADSEAQALSQQKEALYQRLCLENPQDFQLSPGAETLLDNLVERGIPHTIATASDKGNVDFFVEHLQLARWFDVETIVYDDGLRPCKPAPDIYLQAAANLRLAPKRCIVVEDSVSGIQAAHTAGIGYVVALGPSQEHERLARITGVNAVVESLGKFMREKVKGLLC